MNKIKQILIGAAALALSANASASFINPDGSGPMGDAAYADLIQDVIDGMYNGTGRNDILAGKIAKRSSKLNRNIANLEIVDLSGKRERRITKRVARLDRQIGKFLARMDLSGSVPEAVALEINGDSGNESVPEPTIIALLGLGLVGIGVARRMRKKA